MQYREQGILPSIRVFGLQTLRDQGNEYNYGSRSTTPYSRERLEGQAEMVGNYARWRHYGAFTMSDGVTTFDAAYAQGVEQRLHKTRIYNF